MNNTSIIDIDIPFGRLIFFIIKFNFAALAAAAVIAGPILLYMYLITVFANLWSIPKTYLLF